MVPVLYDAHSDPGFFIQMLRVLGDGLQDAAPIPPCIPSHAALAELRASGRPFNLLLPVRHGFGAHHSAGVLQGLSAVAPEVNKGVCRVFLDFCNEATHPAEFAQFIPCIKEAGIDALEQITLICQNRRIAELGLPVRHASFDAFLVAGWSACRAVLMDENPDGQMRFDAFHGAEPQHDILCLNATPRFHRLVTLLRLVEEGFIDLDAPDHAPDCQIPYISYPGLDYVKRDAADARAVDEAIALLKRSGLGRLMPLLPRLLARTPLRVDSFEAEGNDLAFEIEVRHYRNSKISLVTETSMGPDIRRITEKTLKPLALGHPCITIGHPHALALARELGYDTFDDCIDNRYDDKANESMLHREALRSLRDFLNRFDADPELREELKRIGARNMRWTLDGFQAHYYTRWARPLLESLLGTAALAAA